MKIEKLNENQIRCILTREDLEARQIKISELAYGTEKAKELFREMMEMASSECEFEAEDMPLMIEAVPVSSESIVLIVTKTDMPEEMDPRFAQFTDYSDEEEEEYDAGQPYGADSSEQPFPSNSAEEILSALTSGKGEEFRPGNAVTRMYIFENFDKILEVAKVMQGLYDGENTLYKLDDRYYLIVNKSSHSPEEFNRICNQLSEYATMNAIDSATERHFSEHYTPIVLHHALQTISQL